MKTVRDLLDNQPKASRLDFLSVGALVHRLDPGLVPLRAARSLNVHVSGGEYNVAANLAYCFELRTGLATAMVRNGIGELVQARVREMGVTPYYQWFDHDGVRGPNIAIVYSDLGQGVRPPVVFYNRALEAAALLKPGDFDWDQIMGGGIRWFHSGGIFAALSRTTPEVIIEGMRAAKRCGAVCSYDMNYRGKLWQAMGGESRARDVTRQIMEHVDVLIGNEEDIQQSLGLEGPKVHASRLEPGRFFEMIERLIPQFPQVKVVATTLRDVRSANRHSWSALMWLDGQQVTGPVCELDVLDRIGGGDGFAAGLIFGLLDGRSPAEALQLGWAHGAMLTTFPGDVTMAKLSEVEAFARGQSARVQR